MRQTGHLTEMLAAFVAGCLSLCAVAHASTGLWTVNFQTDGTAGATLTGQTTQTVMSGATCSAVQANGKTGFPFLKWTLKTEGSVEPERDYSTDNPLTVRGVNADMTLTAVFGIGIDSGDGLQLVGADAEHPANGKYYLTADLDLSGGAFSPIPSFSGKFYGNGHSIKGMHESFLGLEYGLFAFMAAGAEVRDLTITDADVTNENVTPLFSCLGVLAAQNEGLIDNCHTSGSIKGQAGCPAAAGGLVGTNLPAGTISNSSSTAVVSHPSGVTGGLVGCNYGILTDCHADGAVTSGNFVGGLVGDNGQGSLTRCYATGVASGTSASGGLCGRNNSAILTECFATGDVTSTGSATGGLVGGGTGQTLVDCFATGRVNGGAGLGGGLIGDNISANLTGCYAVGPITGGTTAGLVPAPDGSALIFSKCFWDTESTGQASAISVSPTVAGTFGKNTADMLLAATYVGWGIVMGGGAYSIVEGKTYPYLDWKVPEAAIVAVNPATAGDLAFEVTFSVPVPGFDFSDLNLGYTGLTHLSHTVTAVDPLHPDVWNVEIAVAGTEGSIEADVNVGGVITSDKATAYLLAAPSNPGARNVSTTAITWVWTDNSNMEDGYDVFAGAGTAAPATLVFTTAANATAWTMTGLAVNTQYSFQVQAGREIFASATSDGFSAWTLANRPKPVLLSGPGATSLNVAIDTRDGNPGATVYALRCTTTGKYLQAGGALGTYAVYKTAAAWGTAAVSGLSEYATYGFGATARNGAGVKTWEGTTAYVTTKDVTAPTGSIVINGGASNTPSAGVTLTLGASDAGGSGVTLMRFSDDGATWTPWEPFAGTKAHALLGTDGYKTVRVQFRDAAGNVSGRCSDYILLDTTAPTGTIAINSGANTTSNAIVTLSLTASDGVGGSGVRLMRFSGDGMHWTAWEAMAPTKAYMLPGPNGYNTVRVQYRDAVGNVSDRFNDYILLNSKLAIGAQDLYCIYFRVGDVEYSEKQPTVPLVTNAQDTACPESPFEGPGDVDHRATAQAFLVLPVFERGMWGVN